MIGDDASHDSQPEPGSGSNIFGRVKRLEDVDLRRTWYPRSVVDDLDDHTRALTVILPRPSTASMALSIRFVHTWFSSPPCPGILGRSFSYSLSNETPLSLGPRMVRVFCRPEITSTSPTTALSM